jgi:hypothetical protein
MSSASRFAYAQARLQARVAGLPTDADWERLAAARGLSGFLEEARAGSLRVWVKPFSGQSDTHDIEIGLRIVFREEVAAVVEWLPQRWREAVGWTRWLVLLPLFEHLARGGATPAWLKRDHDLAALLDQAANLDRERLGRAGAGLLLAQGGDPAAAWVAEWRRRWPAGDAKSLRNLESLQALIARHLEDFRQARRETAWELRRRLRARLGLLFHRRLLEPAAAFIYLGLALLDLERLRAELVARALFAAGEAH